jgi:uncharacterized protein YndB with AHSA1/START domain
VVSREVLLPVPPVAVWDSLTRPDELSSWLGSQVELDLRPGGVLRLNADGIARMGVVEAVSPFEYLSFRWRPLVAGPHGPILGPGTRVEFALEAEGEGTRLRVVESGFGAASISRAKASSGVAT